MQLTGQGKTDILGFIFRHFKKKGEEDEPY